MTTSSLSPQALAIIDSYEHLQICNKTINCPYFNNRTTNLRGALRVLVGKGTAVEISDEARIIGLRDRVDVAELDEPTLLKFLTDHHLGLDCAALAYYTLDAELLATQNKRLKQVLSFKSKNILRRLIIKLRTVENTSVAVLHDNSEETTFDKLTPGNLIIALGGGIEHDYNHVLIITSTTRNDVGKLHTIEYAHAYNWKKEGKYTKGIRRGIIEITDPKKSILEQQWTEDGKIGEENETWVYLKGAQAVHLTQVKV